MRGYHEAVKSRVGGFIIVIVIVLAVLAVRLWTMQVIHGEDFLAQAPANRTRTATHRLPVAVSSIETASSSLPTDPAWWYSHRE